MSAPDATETRRLLGEHQALFGAQSLDVPYGVLEKMLDGEQRRARWIERARAALRDAAPSDPMLARRIAVLLSEQV